MYIENIKIDSFGTLINREFSFSHGINIIEGENESGKTAIAMFIKFMLYGLNGKASDGMIPERKKYINWNTGTASGSMTVTVHNKNENGQREPISYLIERSLIAVTKNVAEGRESYRESLKIIDPNTGAVCMKEAVPGLKFLGVPEEVFVNTVFIRQSSGTAVDGSEAGEAIENMLFSADESVNTQLAQDKLDKARKYLLHKNGGGGIINEFEHEKRMLESAINEMKFQNAEIVAIEGSLESFIAEYEQIKNEADKLRQISLSYESMSAVKRLDTYKAAKNKIVELNAKLADIDEKFGDEDNKIEINSNYLKFLRECAKSITATNSALRECEIKLDNISQNEADEYDSPLDGTSRENIEIEAENHYAKKRSFMSAGAVMFVFCIMIIIVAVALKIIHPMGNGAIYAAIGGALFFGIGIACVVASMNSQKKLSDILNEWGADSIHDLSISINYTLASLNKTTDFTALQKSLANESEIIRDKLEKCVNDALDASAIVGAVPDDEGETIMISAVLDALARAEAEAEQIIKIRDEILREITFTQSKCDAISDGLHNIDENKVRETLGKLGENSAELMNFDIHSVKRELEDNEKACASLTAKIHNLEKQLAALRATVSDPIVIAQRIEEININLTDMKKRHAAYVLAISTLSEAGESVQTSVAPRLAGYACTLMNALTDGKYNSVGIGTSLAITLGTESGSRELDYMSGGISDAAYISLRLALIELLFPNETPALIFDESFAKLDATRLSHMLSIISAAAYEEHDDNDNEDIQQSLIFTCHIRESEIMNKIGKYKKLAV